MSKLMQIYLFEFFIFFNFLLCFFKKIEKKLEIKIISINIFILILFLSIQEIGIDLIEYKRIYSKFEAISIDKSFEYLRFEPGFLWIMNISKKLNHTFDTFNLILSFLGIITIYIYFIKNEKNKFLLFYFYLVLNVLYFNTNIIRQNLSMIFFIVMLKKSIEHKKKYIWIILSILFHKTGFICLIIYLFKYFNEKEMKKMILLKSVLCLILGFLLKEVLIAAMTLFDGDINLFNTFKRYLLNFREDFLFPSLLHRILFYSYVIYPFIINLISLLFIKKIKLNDIYLKCLLIGNYICLFFIGMGRTELGIRIVSYFFYINFYIYVQILTNYRKKNFLFLGITFIIFLYQILLLIHINRYVRIIPNLFN